ncbi:hypothetical protein L596_010774 [Steinernema carpocapsae]|uniref:Uncharacterized protein n=1 Tax=Steinernema carpocapsae TaxID=34508 RepID=A0A4U5PJZ6_STECR|nr:hypothetical protein L596_010774 [Steinernema carpocapsae]
MVAKLVGRSFFSLLLSSELMLLLTLSMVSLDLLALPLVRPPVSLEDLLLLLLLQTLSVAFLGQLDPSPAPPSQQITAGTL